MGDPVDPLHIPLARFVDDPTLPALSSTVEGVNGQGVTERGTVRPRIIQLEDFENTDKFTMPLQGLQNTTGADWAVSILYKYDREALSKFLDTERYPNFRFIHLLRDDRFMPAYPRDHEAWPFVIERQGKIVESGLAKGYEENGNATCQWECAVKYEIVEGQGWKPIETNMYDSEKLDNVVLMETGPSSRERTEAFENRARTVNGVLKNPRPWIVVPGFGIEVQYLFSG